MTEVSEEGESIFCEKAEKEQKTELCPSASNANGLVVRPMSVDDADIVARLTVKAFKAKFEWAVGKKSIEKIVAGQAAENRDPKKYQHRIFIAEYDGKVAGCIGIKFFGDKHKLLKHNYKGMGCLPLLRLRCMAVSQNEDVKDPTACYINELCVAEDYRGKGIGTALLQAAEAEAVKHGCTKTLLHVALGNPALHLYQREGYKKKGEEIDLISYCIIGVKGWYFMEKELIT
ncbi:uncharacterized protein LOC106155500 [Lingula anatina]|uniref:Uncharacterized protein LOC106155500 n=1 Tax=Lingula anatina TaxID=7574 RepID=A0A1S3HI91_LINAN|nr:uncharacterized protein LOC106155500 [Lingula anatina]|eukprot:XP_013385833.1 uncharacterized protein LOC106155500 [Lingula anatina]